MTDPDIQRQGHGVIAHVGRIVTGGAVAGERGGLAQCRIVIEAADAGDLDWEGVEKHLPRCDVTARFRPVGRGIAALAKGEHGRLGLQVAGITEA